jgi:hypothetical protein
LKWGKVKKIIAIIIITALILAAFTMLSAPNVKADSTSEVNVVSYSWYLAPANTELAANAGDLIIIGEIQNVGSSTISNITVQGTAFSSSGQSLAITTAPAFVYDMLPGEKAPFYIDLTPQDSLTQDTTWISSASSVLVSVTQVVDTTASQYSELSIPQGAITHILADNNTFTIVGYLSNNGTIAAQNIWLVTTFYNSAGKVIGLNFTNYLTPAILLPNQSTSFLITPADNTVQLSNEIANYTLMIDSNTTGSGHPPIYYLISGFVSPSTTPTSSPTKSPTTQTGQLSTTSIIAIVVVVAVVAVVVALLLVRRRRNVPPPPPPPSQPSQPT